METQPIVLITEEDGALIPGSPSTPVKTYALTPTNFSSNKNGGIEKKNSGVQPGNERLAKKQAPKKEFIPPHSLLPNGINEIQDLKKIRETQHKQKMEIQPKTFPLENDISISTMEITPDSKYAILGTSNGAIIMFDIQKNEVRERLDEAHSGSINCVTFGGEENKYLISTSQDFTIKIFDWREKLKEIQAIKSEFQFLRVVCSELYLAAACNTAEVMLYKLSALSDEPLHIFETNGENLNGLAIHKNNNHLFICRHYDVEIYDLQTFKRAYIFEDAHGGEYLFEMEISADCEMLVTAAQDMSMKIWDIAEREEIHSFGHVHNDLISSVFLSSDKKYVVSSSDKGSIKVINLETGLTVHNIETKDHTGILTVLSPNNEFLLVAGKNELKFWNFESGKYFLRDQSFPSLDLPGESKPCLNSKFFVQFSYDDDTVHVCDMESGEIFDLSAKIELAPHTCVDVCPNGEYIICYQLYQEKSLVKVFYRDEDLSFEIPIEERIMAMTISPDSGFLIYSNDIDIKFINIEKGKGRVAKVFPKISEHQVDHLWMSPNGDYIAVDTLDQSISLVDLRSQEIFIFRDIHENKITDLAWSFDSQYFATGSQEKTIKVFDVKSKQLVHQFSAIKDAPTNCLCFSPDNRYIILGNTDVHFYDLQTKSHAMTIENPYQEEGNAIVEVAISPNGKALFLYSSKRWVGYPEIYRLDSSINRNSDNNNSPPQEQDLISYSYFKGYYSRFNSIEDSLLKNNLPRTEVFSKILESNFCLLPYSWSILHIAAIDGNDGFIKNMPKYDDFKISFLLDKYEKTPLHYMIAQDKITYSSVNIMLTYICDYLDDCGEKRKYEYQQIIKSLNPLCWFILLTCEIKLRERFLSLCFIDSPTPYKMELPIFGEPTQKSTFFAQSPEVTPEIKDIIWDEGQDQVWFKTNLLYLDYNLTSDDMRKTIKCLLKQDSEELFRTPLVSKLLQHLWTQSKMTLYILLAIFSAFMTCLSVYIVLHDRILAFEIVILAIASLLLVGEALQMSTAQMDYLTNPWNMLDLTQLLMTVAFIITRFTDDDNDLARDWMSTVIILAGYFRWVSYLRVFQPIRNFMEIFGTVVKDMFSFGVIIGFIVIGFSISFVAFGIGNESETEYGPYGAYLYNAYNSLFGPVEDPDYGSYDLSQKILIAAIAFLFNVILLNLLISIMGESMNKVLAMRDKTETLTRFAMIMEAVTFMKFFKRGKINVSNKNYLVSCFSLHSEENKGAPESEMEMRIGKKFVTLNENVDERMKQIEEYFESAKVSEEKTKTLEETIEKLTDQLADFREFYLRTRGLKEFEGLKTQYKDIKRLEKKIEENFNNEDNADGERLGEHEGERIGGQEGERTAEGQHEDEKDVNINDEDDDISSLDGKKNDIRLYKGITSKLEPESGAIEQSNLENQDNRI